jgi:flavodoxin
MKALVVYYSESSNTQKLAQAIASGLGTQPVSLESVEARELAGYDLICIGTPVQYGAPARKVREFVARMPAMTGTKCAAFCTMHMFGDRNTIRTLKTWLEAKGMVFLGGCSARGWSRLVGNFGPRIFNRGRPNKEELDRAEQFGRTLRANLVQPPVPFSDLTRSPPPQAARQTAT